MFGLSMLVFSKWQCVALPSCWHTFVRALFYWLHAFLDHTTNIRRKVHAPRRVSALWAPYDVQNCHLDKTNMDNLSMQLKCRLVKIWQISQCTSSHNRFPKCTLTRLAPIKRIHIYVYVYICSYIHAYTVYIHIYIFVNIFFAGSVHAKSKDSHNVYHSKAIFEGNNRRP